MKKIVSFSFMLIAISTIVFLFINSQKSIVNNKKLMVRIAKLEIDSAQLEIYKAELKEEIEASVRVEAGVLSINAVYDKKNPTKVTVFEIYADTAAYQAHIQTPHFLKYKNGTLKMVKALELIDVVPIAMANKMK